ncbi:hypothetical protein PROP_00392 [Propionicimonas sp. T2.31MG-18]|uniref:hypothetical protein n=1 Tax=Propionicimonas sp. T2.31MG-18 TaxID=3157620 RepID=UPI0035ED3790
MAYVNEHHAYGELRKPDRRALRDILKTAFPIGGSSHTLWSDFVDTTAFLRRSTDADALGLPEGIIGGAIVMSHPEDQYDYLAYIAIHPDHRYRRRLFGRADEPHHGTELLHDVYDVMRSRVGPSRLQRYLMIEPAGNDALRFYLRALPSSEYPVRFDEIDRVIAVSYDGLAL